MNQRPLVVGARSGALSERQTTVGHVRVEFGDGPHRPNSPTTSMKNPLESITGTIIAGLLLTAILYEAVRRWLT